jgi:hypothetical protein
MKTNMKAIIGMAAVLILAIAAFAYAQGGYGRYMDGYDGHMMGPGYGGHMMGYDDDYGPYMRGYDNWDNLSDKDTAKLDAAHEKFLKATQDLRSQIDEKQFALQKELDKNNPDKGKVLEMQKALSGLKAEFDQKALTHQLEVNKLRPERSVRDFYGEGYGHGHGGYCR